MQRDDVPIAPRALAPIYLVLAAGAGALGLSVFPSSDADRSDPSAERPSASEGSKPIGTRQEGGVPPLLPIGAGPRFRPAVAHAAADAGRAIGGLRCVNTAGRRSAAHLELFAAGRVIVVPAGIGVARPRHRTGAYVVPGGCRYPASTLEPTGVIELTPGARVTLGDLFALWDRPLGRTRLAGHRGRVRAWVDGRRWDRDPRAIPLAHHAQIVLATGPPNPVHPSYRFPPGL